MNKLVSCYLLLTNLLYEESASEEEEYKEFKVGKLKAYSYKDYSSYEEVILLENISENEDRYVTMEISQISPSDDESGKFFKENKEAMIFTILHCLKHRTGNRCLSAAAFGSSKDYSCMRHGYSPYLV